MFIIKNIYKNQIIIILNKWVLFELTKFYLLKIILVLEASTNWMTRKLFDINRYLFYNRQVIVYLNQIFFNVIILPTMLIIAMIVIIKILKLFKLTFNFQF